MNEFLFKQTGCEKKIWIVAKMALLTQLSALRVSQYPHDSPETNKKTWEGPLTNQRSILGQLTNNKKLVLNDTTSLTLVIISSDLNNLNKLPEVKFARKSHFTPVPVRVQPAEWPVSEKVWELVVFVLAPWEDSNYISGVWSRYPNAHVSWGLGRNYPGPGPLCSPAMSILIIPIARIMRAVSSAVRFTQERY